jgi:hypothetical protein
MTRRGRKGNSEVEEDATSLFEEERNCPMFALSVRFNI